MLVPRKLAAIATVAVAVLIVSGCASSSPPQASKSGGTASIAIFHEFSGPNAAYGPEAAAGCYPAVRLINAAGGVLGSKFECLPTDSKGDPADAIPAARKLISSTANLVGVIGGGSDNAPAVVPIFNQAKIPIFSTTGQSVFDTNTAAYFWRLLSPDTAQGYAMAAAAKQLGRTRVATVFGNDVAAQGSAPSAIAGIKKLGLKLVAHQTLALDQPSYRTEVEALIQSNPQVIISEADPQTTATYLSELKGLGTLVPLITDPVSQEPNWITAVSGSIGGDTLARLDTAVVAYAPMSTVAYKAFSGALLASAAQVPKPSQWTSDLYSVADYDSAIVMALAMLEAHSTAPSKYNGFITQVTAAHAGHSVVHTFAEGKKLLSQGKSIQYVGAVGPIQFNRNHNANNAFALETYGSGGQWTPAGLITAAALAAAQ